MKLNLIVECPKELYHLLQSSKEILGIKIEKIEIIEKEKANPLKVDKYEEVQVETLEDSECSSESCRESSSESSRESEEVEKKLYLNKKLDITEIVIGRIKKNRRLNNCLKKHGLLLKLGEDKLVNQVTVSKTDEGFIYELKFESPLNKGVDENILKNVIRFWKLFGIPVHNLKNEEPEFGKRHGIPIRLTKESLMVVSKFGYDDTTGKVSSEFDSENVSNKEFINSSEIEYLIREHLEV